MEQAGTLIEGTEDDVRATLANVRAASGEAVSILQREKVQLHSTLASLEAATTKLDRVAANLEHLTHDTGDSVAVAVRQVNTLLRRLEGSVGAVERSSADLEAILASVNAGKGTLGRFVQDPSLYNRLDAAALQLERVLTDFEQNPGRYLRELTLVEVF